jgi:hypothetical protein
MPSAFPRLRAALPCAAMVLLASGAIATPIAPAAVKKASARGDRLIGTDAPDVLRGGAGPDVLDGRGGADRIYGGAGADQIFADGYDRVDAGPGDDRVVLVAEAMSFQVACGAGRDRLTVKSAAPLSRQALRPMVSGCETVVLNVVTPPATTPAAAPPSAPAPAPAPAPTPTPTPTRDPTPTPDPTDPSPPAPSTPANVFVSAAGSDAGACTATAPCRSLSRAYSVAKAGDVVEVTAGTYDAQAVPSGTKAVTFRGAAGAKLRELDNSADNVTFDGIEVDANFAAVSGFENQGADNVTFKNGRIGNVTDEKGALISGANFTFDNVVFHDIVLRTDGVHLECVYAIGVPGMRVLNSTFRDCAVMDLFFTYGDWWSPLPPGYGNVTLENNVFEHSEMESNAGWHYYSLYVAHTGPQSQGWGGFSGWTVRNNTFELSANIDKTSASGSRWVGNLGDWNCVPGVTYSHNVGMKCAASDKQVSPATSSATVTAALGWLAPLTHDFHLGVASPAIGAGDPFDHPATDRDGNPRGAAPDAGAYERG